MSEDAGPTEPGPPVPPGPPASPRPAPPRAKRRRPPVMVLIAIALSVPILVVTFTKEPSRNDAVSMSDLREHYGWRGSVLSLVDTLRRQFPDDYAGSELGADEQHSGWVGFRGAVPAGARPLLELFRADPRNGVVEVGEYVGFTAADLRARLAEAQAAAEATDGVGEVLASSEGRTGVIALRVTREDAASDDPADDPADDLADDVLDAVRDRLSQRVEPWTDGARATSDAQPVRVTLAG